VFSLRLPIARGVGLKLLDYKRLDEIKKRNAQNMVIEGVVRMVSACVAFVFSVCMLLVERVRDPLPRGREMLSKRLKLNFVFACGLYDFLPL